VSQVAQAETPRIALGPSARGTPSSRRWAGPLARVVFILAVFAILYGPLVLLAAFSFNDSTILALPFNGFTTRWYHEALQNHQLREALVNSVVLATIVAPFCLVIGTLTAFGLTRFRFRLRGALGALVGAPLVLPWLVIGISALLFFSSLLRFVTRVGLPNLFPLGLRTAAATQIICTFPLVTAIVSAQLLRFERAQEEAAVDMGASRLQVLRYVILPHIAPALAAAAIFAYTWSFNNFEISFFTMGFNQTFPLWVFGTVRNTEHTAIVNAISTLISVVQVAFLYVALRLMRARGGDAVSVVAGVEPVRGGE